MQAASALRRKDGGAIMQRTERGNTMDTPEKKRFAELAERAWSNSTYVFTPFLDLNQLSLFHAALPSLPRVPYQLFGGAEGCERKMLRFGSEELCGYDMPFPIACLRMAPVSKKFADKLTHRDFLGSLMALGMEREMLGDIIVKEDCAYLFCHERISEYICRNLTQVKRTTICCEESAAPPEGELFRTEKRIVQLSSERLDALVAHVFKMSRNDAQALFPMGKIFVDGRQCLSPGYTPKAGQVISVRGFGRMKYTGVESLSKKGKCNTVVELYI